MRKLNPEHIEPVLGLLHRGPFYQYIGMNIYEVGDGFCNATLDIRPELTNHFGHVHGGAYAALFDAVLYWSCYSAMDETEGFVTLDLSINDLGSVVSGTTIYCHGKAVSTEHHIMISEGTMVDGEGRVLATATSKLYGSPKIDPVVTALQRIDPSVVIPPKFIEVAE